MNADGEIDSTQGIYNIKERLEYELSVIQTMGYVDYFLIVWDYINYSRVNGIPVGPGRDACRLHRES